MNPDQLARMTWTYALVHFVLKNTTGGAAWGRFRLTIGTPHGVRADAWRVINDGDHGGDAPDPIVPGQPIGNYTNTVYTSIPGGTVVTIDREIVCADPASLSGPSIELDTDARNAFAIVEPPKLVMPDNWPNILYPRAAFGNAPKPIDAPPELWG